MDQRRTAILATAESVKKEVLSLSRSIYAHPELGNQEQQAVGWCRETLVRHGFHFETVAGVPTAFVATRRGARPGPCIGFLAEYDALPGLGHACGHNLIAASAVGAGLCLGPHLDELGGTIKVFGCPAEEEGTGKPAMLAAGAFAGVDAGLTFHAYHTTSVMEQCTGVRRFTVEFRGKATHAANDPWAGASALDGVLLTWMNINALRQFTHDGVRIHGIISHGGDAFNVIAERATTVIAVRATDPAELTRIVDRVKECIQAGALASGTQVQIRLDTTLDPVKPNRALTEIVRRNLAELGRIPGEPWRAGASTDFGNVSQTLPAVLISVDTWPTDVAFHTTEAAAAAGTEHAYAAMFDGARTMALVAAELIQDAGALARVKEDFAGHR